MRPLIVFLVLALLLGGVLWLAGVFDQERDTPADLPGGPDGATDGADGTENGGDPNLTVTPPAPDERPPLEELAFPEGTRALLLARRKLPENMFTLQLLDSARVAYQAWFFAEGGGSGSTHAMPALTGPPTADDLAAGPITLLVLDNVDPARLPDGFWAAVQDRVRSGRLGLLVQAYPPYSASDAALKVHPVLEHPVTRALVPVTEAEPFAGRGDGRPGVPGVFPSPRPFEVAEPGTQHPATRLSPWPEWSRVWWQVLADPEAGGMGAPFCYPVTDVADGATTLVGVLPKEGDAYPAIVVGAEELGRVLWLGVPQLGWDFHYNSIKKKRVGTLMHNLLAWTAGA